MKICAACQNEIGAGAPSCESCTSSSVRRARRLMMVGGALAAGALVVGAVVVASGDGGSTSRSCATGKAQSGRSSVTG